LGFNGPNYWGASDPRADFSYNWTGLPETMNEKRQMQVGAFAVYNKDKDYDLWPSPFNRSEVKARGDLSIHVYESGGSTYLGPLGQGDEISFRYDPTIFIGASYIFDAELSFVSEGGQSIDDALDVSTFYKNDGIWTRILVKNTNDSVLVQKVGSAAFPALLTIASWEDTSDWTYSDVSSQFIGLWGNKGNSLSMDFAFDSLDLHGYDEVFALHLDDQGGALTIDQLLERSGLEPTEWSPYAVDYFKFSVGLQDDDPELRPARVNINNGDFDDSTPPTATIINGVYELPTPSTEVIDSGVFADLDPIIIGGNCGLGSPEFPVDIIEYDNGDFDNIVPAEGFLNNGVLDPVTPPDALANSGTYEKTYLETIIIPPVTSDYDNGDFDDSTPPTGFLDNGTLGSPILPDAYEDSGTYERIIVEEVVVPDDFEFFSCSDECRYNLSITQTYSAEKGGIDSFVFKLEALEPCALLEFPCLEWVFDPDLDNGDYEKTVGPRYGPWAIANNGEYDNSIVCLPRVLQGANSCEGTDFCGFSNGTYDRPEGDGINCDSDLGPEVVCEESDGGIYTVNGSPDYSDCDCYTDGCCLVDSNIYDLNQTPPAYLGPEAINGGIFGLTDTVPPPVRPTVDNGDFNSSVPPTATVTNGVYELSTPSTDNLNNGLYPEEVAPDVPLQPCFTDPLRVQLKDVLESVPWRMEPSIQNALTPLRIWKNHVLTVTDREPGEGTDYYNFLVADENRGPEPEDSFRYFVRLPLEYERNGKEWNRAVAVCNNQGYFSTPPKLSETEDDPKTTRPYLYDETYWRTDLQEYSTFYSEGYLVSQLRQDTGPVQPGFTDSEVAFDGGNQSGFALTLISEYDPFSLRIPDPDGEWIGQYLVYGTNPESLKTGYLATDLAIGAFLADPLVDDPVWDQSAVKRPNVEFPDSGDKAALKNYVVSYAYFACDFSAADDPVFEPGLAPNWRRKEVDCSENIGGECVPSIYPTNTAYRLHQ